MKKKLVLFILFVGGLFIIGKAGNVPPEKLIKVAKNAFYEKALMNHINIKYDEISIEPSNLEMYYAIKDDEYVTTMRVYKIENHGFIILSKYYFSKPVIGYSFDNNVSYLDNPNKKLPPNFMFFLEHYNKQIGNAVKNGYKNNKNEEEWTWYANATAKQIEEKVASKSVKSVAPLLLTNWNQGKYYNTSCPEDPQGDDGHVYVGCVALSTSMIMKYYNYPETGQGSKTSYNTYNGGYGTFTVDFSQHTYRWYNMPLSATKYNQDLADLLFHVGVAVNMHWGSDGSGTYTAFVPGALTDYFKYSSDANLIQRSDYSTSEWISTLQNQLDNKWPMVYSGQGNSGGHAWDCDGYNDTYFHMNWGWSGAYNGFYDLDDLTPGGTTFDSDFQVVINIYPASGYPVGCQTNDITGFEGSFEDGSGNQTYGNNWDCFYKIQPSCGHYASISFPQFDLGSGDKLIIYDGITTNAPIIETLSANNPPTSYDIYRATNPDGLLLEFITDGSDVGEGWYATYNVKNCSIDTLTENEGVVEDGSKTCDYSPSTYCKWYINTTNNALLLTFDEWDLPSGENNDYLQIYKGLGTSNLITKLTGDSTPTNILIPSGQATLRFMTDADNDIANGWRISYAPASYIDMQKMEGISVAVYPNPISNNAYIDINTTKPMNLTFELYDYTGKVIGSYNRKNVNGTLSIPFKDIYSSKLMSGLYILKVKNNSFVKAIKIVKY